MSDPRKTLRYKVWQAARAVRAEFDADVIICNAGIERGLESLFTKLISRKEDRSKNVILILITPGGDADVAFRIARLLQRKYENFYLFVSGWCKSAGTLIAVGAQTVFFSENGELGPLDIQMGQKDEIVDFFISGLDLDYGVKSMRQTSFAMFEYYMLQIIRNSGGKITFKTAAEVSATMAQAYISKFTEQISPMSVGETVRLMTIASDYGRRLDMKYQNLKESSLDTLVSGYSSHSFVIDLQESEDLFERAYEATESLNALAGVLGNLALYPTSGVGKDDVLGFLGDEAEDEILDNEQSPEAADGSGDEQRPAKNAAEEAAGHAGDPEGSAPTPISEAGDEDATASEPGELSPEVER